MEISAFNWCLLGQSIYHLIDRDLDLQTIIG